MSWYRKSADQGDPGGQLALSAMYYSGQGVPRDMAAAASWLKKAADQGFANAQLLLGIMYEDGSGVLQDYILAHMWFNLAVTGGEEAAASNRDRIASKMTPAQIAEAQRLAREWKPTIASR
jgi:TPR repeat protein